MTPSITVNQISKLYKMGTKLTDFRDLFVFRNNGKDPDFRWAVKDVSFELQPGESLGIIGPNGAGKTTILKMLSRVTKPTKGDIVINGRFSALIELGAGFHPDLTGRENVFLNGTILGMTKSEIQAKFDEIVDFAGINEYLDTPVKRYSSGMYARLGFAIAAHVEPKVLLVDEVLAVGDYAFQQKCYALMDQMRSKGTSLILVSHNMEVVRRVCGTGMVMYRGENIFQGTAAEAVVAYSDAIRQTARRSQMEIPKEDGLSERVMTFDAEVESIKILDSNGQMVNVLQSGTTASVALDVRFNKHVRQPIFAITIRTPDGLLVYNITTRWMGLPTADFSAGDRCRVLFEIKLPLLENFYELGADITSSDLTHFYDRLESAMGFSIIGSSGAKGFVDLDAKFRIENLG